MRERGTEAFQDILFALADDAADLARKECDLFRAETRETVRRLVFAGILLVLGVAIAILAMVFLGVASFEWLVVALDSRVLAAFSVAGIAAIVAAFAVIGAYYRLVRTSFIPKRTLASIRQDVRIFLGEFSDE